MTNEVLFKTLKATVEDRLNSRVSDVAVDLFINHCREPGLLLSLLQQKGFEELLKKVFPELIERLLLEPEILAFFEAAFPKMLQAFFLYDYTVKGGRNG